MTSVDIPVPSSDPAQAAASDAAAGAPPEGAPTADAPAPAPAPEAAPWEGKTPEELWKASEKIREESISYKERFRPWEQVVGDMHPTDQTTIREFLTALNSRDPQRIAQEAARMRASLDALSPAQQQAVVDAAGQAAAAAPEYDPYDATQVDQRVEKLLEQRLGERDKAQAQERAIADAQVKMGERAKELADKHKIADLGDPQSAIGRLLYITANDQFQTEQDPMVRLDLAAQHIEEILGKRAQELLKAKGADAAPSPAPADAGQPTGAVKPRTMEDAKRAAEARILASEIVG